MVLGAAAALPAAAKPRSRDRDSADSPEVGPVEVERDFTGGFGELEKLIGTDELPAEYAQAVRPDMYPQPSDRDPIDVIARRTAALLADVARRPGSPDLSAERRELADLVERMNVVRAAGQALGRDEFAEFRKLYWRISRENPLLDFDRLLFIKRHRARKSHMVDQFLGANARPGGGLYVLEDPFGPEPRVVDVLAGSVVRSGRLKGRKLEGGCFLSPDLSFDGRTIVFAYCECGQPDSDFRRGWGLQTCFHLFRVNVDGSDLVQLTDGRLNDFDPCWLPNGRIAFISERRGGYGRCHGGRDAPSYTLASVNPDGSDITYLSYHESNEWQPSVTNHGQIVYTRWDYVDRGTNQAHHPWTTTADGRDARALHGNYPQGCRGLHLRPWMEMDIRAIPGSRKFVATAAPHHGQAYGSFVVLDPDLEDDDAMSQLRRLTPEVRFPEAERGRGEYATAWPLDETYYLCAAGGDLYLIDAFGGRQLLYKGPDVPCLSPIPLKARPRPPVVPHATAVGLPPETRAGENETTRQARGGPDPESNPDDRATVSVMNVTNGLLPWPEGTTIKALRIVQIIPKPSNRRPGFCGTGRTSIREVIGAVPVEPDGSAHFYAPTGMGIYFQALDEHGMAVQSMRSLTYVHPGERLSCRGCHEPRHRAPPVPDEVPLALRRPPSEITPGPEGSRPFDYRVLVEPVIEAKCDGCHRQEKSAPSLDRNRLMRYVPYYVSPKPYEPSRTVPGEFGARGSKLLGHLVPSHHGVKLTREQFRRLVVWMDCNCASVGTQQLTERERMRLAEYRGTDFEKHPK